MTLDIGTRLLVILLLDELKEALGKHDADAAISTIDHIGTVAGRAYADRLTHDLVVIGFNRLAQLGNTDTGQSGAA